MWYNAAMESTSRERSMRDYRKINLDDVDLDALLVTMARILTGTQEPDIHPEGESQAIPDGVGYTQRNNVPESG